MVWQVSLKNERRGKQPLGIGVGLGPGSLPFLARVRGHGLSQPRPARPESHRRCGGELKPPPPPTAGSGCFPKPRCASLLPREPAGLTTELCLLPAPADFCSWDAPGAPRGAPSPAGAGEGPGRGAGCAGSRDAAGRIICCCMYEEDPK